MKYEKFKTEIVKALSGFYGGNTEVELVEALRNNGKRRDAVRICVDGEDSSTVPAIYLEGFFRMYDAGDMDMEGCVKGITELRAASVCSPQIAQFSHRLLSWDAVREKVYPMLLSAQAAVTDKHNGNYKRIFQGNKGIEFYEADALDRRRKWVGKDRTGKIGWKLSI